MKRYIISENQSKSIIRKLKREQVSLIEKKWNRLTENEQELVVELLKVTYPQKKNRLNEAWYNTVMDILGIVDPTGVIDIINSISYFSQGEHLFGFLTLVSAIPYAGDLVGKPVIGALKMGKAGTAELKVAMEAAKLGKTAEAASTLTKLAEKPGVVGSFLQNAKNWAPSIATKVNKLPGGIFKGFKNTILDYLKLFENAALKSTKIGTEAGKLATKFKAGTGTAKEVESLMKMMKSEKILDPKLLSKPGLFSQIVYGGVPRLFGNRRTRILMGQTKFFFGFLDFLGIGNFVGPDELAKNLGGEDVMMEKMEEYQKTPQAQQYFKEEFENNPEFQEQMKNSEAEGSSEGATSEFIKKLLGSLLTPSLT
jgi:hypothetical protein